MSRPDQTLTLRRPDDWHLHVRDGAQLAAVVPFTARQFRARAGDAESQAADDDDGALAALSRAHLAAVPAGMSFEPQMTLYLTDRTSPGEIRGPRASGFVVGTKLYPGRRHHAFGRWRHFDRQASGRRSRRWLSTVSCCRCTAKSRDGQVDVFDREQAVHRSRC